MPPIRRPDPGAPFDKRLTPAKLDEIAGVAPRPFNTAFDVDLLDEIDAALAVLEGRPTWSAESLQDLVAAMLVSGTYDDAAGTYVLPGGLTQEQVEDMVAAMFGAQGTYNDTAGTYTLPAGMTEEQVQDIVGAMGRAGVNVTYTYDDTAGTFTIGSTASGGTATAAATLMQTAMTASDHFFTNNGGQGSPGTLALLVRADRNFTFDTVRHSFRATAGSTMTVTVRLSDSSAMDTGTVLATSAAVTMDAPFKVRDFALPTTVNAVAGKHYLFVYASSDSSSVRGAGTTIISTPQAGTNLTWLGGRFNGMAYLLASSQGWYQQTLELLTTVADYSNALAVPMADTRSRTAGRGQTHHTGSAGNTATYSVHFRADRAFTFDTVRMVAKGGAGTTMRMEYRASDPGGTLGAVIAQTDQIGQDGTSKLQDWVLPTVHKPTVGSYYHLHFVCTTATSSPGQNLSNTLAMPQPAEKVTHLGGIWNGSYTAGSWYDMTFEFMHSLIKGTVGPAFTVGTTAQRPSNPQPGDQHADTTLGKPVWFFAGSWRDATGTVA
ncbi:hypothetical protein GCM10008955_01320 [Deinococcus malanensis]|uniref:Minor tail protein n=1 Tax=Deinococcus malanensis TaxID=1706855 RepID=A0ABQ2EL64_9DEIO|nr:hypothetical protein [Deinococcus malanensis]GGK11817.1 hypothetical protein GCM10008955_01320 [Deinococcus malanensis]